MSLFGFCSLQRYHSVTTTLLGAAPLVYHAAQQCAHTLRHQFKFDFFLQGRVQVMRPEDVTAEGEGARLIGTVLSGEIIASSALITTVVPAFADHQVTARSTLP